MLRDEYSLLYRGIIHLAEGSWVTNLTDAQHAARGTIERQSMREEKDFWLRLWRAEIDERSARRTYFPDLGFTPSIRNLGALERLIEAARRKSTA